jgi:uncharacterized protein YjbI with pentapeptide repeats
MSKQDDTQKTTLQRPATNDEEAWKGYWKLHGQPWRTEPAIETGRQNYLAERRNIIPDIKQGIYPFKDIKLSRADVEWLLSTHENGRGPVVWSDEIQRERIGLDVRGADLRQADLHSLPLARLCAGLPHWEWAKATLEQRTGAVAQLEEANLRDAQLAGSYLRETRLTGTYLRWAQLEEADLNSTQLKGAYLRFAHLKSADLRNAKLAGANIRGAELDGAYLTNATMGDEKQIGPLVADTFWGNVNLAVVKWSQVNILGDEQKARQKKTDKGEEKDKVTWLEEYENAVRANRQLAIALQSQGLNEDAARFAYRAQRLQRVVLRRQRKFGSYLFSLFLDLLAGYGYLPGRSVFWYLVIIVGFATAYYTIGHISPLEAFILSLTSFHGRGFFPGTNITLSDPRVVLAALEAVIGLFIEISFIATFTKRFLGS